ncbi:hypothetical protein [Rhodococcus sp. UFZ-B548]|uniref:hypothetical protein n=1 Tax=Rhodococcus sp. UFZ-B548 TaxID=2742212 RepID=UPI0015F66B2A|nr:hypothetical protein [Rhodococcus sp. UFZ-B548]
MWTLTGFPEIRHTDPAEAYGQSIELVVAAEEIGIDDAHFHVHHCAEQLTAPFPLLAAAAERTR